MLVICSEPIEPLTLVRCKPIGVIAMKDSGKMDEKIIAVCKDDPTYNMYDDICQLPSHTFEEMRHFFSVYKTLETKETVVDEVQGKEQAVQIIEHCLDNYIDCFCK